MIKAEPFLKWAGGKRQLIPEIEKVLPKKIRETKSIDCYVEPFVGGGALLFYLLSNYKVKKAIINDINPLLILSYKVIKKYPNELISELKTLEDSFLKLDLDDREKLFYSWRKEFNSNIGLSINTEVLNLMLKQVHQVALLIALNKTCFNGLFRQNSKGEFNVPYGKYKNPKILNKSNLKNCSLLLKDVEINCGNYFDIKLNNSIKSLLYFDPPYRPISKTSGFTKYSKEDFGEKEQIQLANYYNELSQLGHFLLLSNSDPKNKDNQDDFFDSIYKNFTIRRVLAKRFINCDSDKRGNVFELLIMNY